MDGFNEGTDMAGKAMRYGAKMAWRKQTWTNVHGVEGRSTPPRLHLACIGVGTPTRDNAALKLLSTVQRSSLATGISATALFL
ncbi:hypothetical protein LXL04_011211 [Taraxacum kok-saghyz]